MQSCHIIYPGFDFEIARAMLSKPRNPKLTATELAQLDVIDLCSSSSKDEVAATDQRARLEPLVEPLRSVGLHWQPAHYTDEVTPSSDGEATNFH